MRLLSHRQRAPLPLLVRWREPDNPFPTRAIRMTPAKRATPARSGQPFDFCAGVRRLLGDIVVRCPDFQHVQVSRLLIAVTQARSGYLHGLQARVTPLRFPGGRLIRQRRGVAYHIQRYFLDDHEFLYVMTFCLPRFVNQTFDQKMITLFHELYHIHPEFNGDMRRHEGRYHIHTHPQCEYDRNMWSFAREYLAGKPDPSLTNFLRMDFGQLQERHEVITGIVVPRPKIIPLVGPFASAANVTPLFP